MCIEARLHTSAKVAAGVLINDSLNKFARNPLTKALTNISSLGLVSPILISQNRLRKCFKVSSGRCFMSNMSTICNCLGRLTANRSRKNWEKTLNDVIDELESLLNHFKAVPARVSTNILHRIASFPPEISIYARKALRWASGSFSPVNGGTFGMMK